jgi:glycosyltransferase involved in cell wall biosynthesis
MRVLHLLDSGGIYGKERVILELMEQQARTGLVPVLGSITRTGENKPIIMAARERGLEGVTLVVRRLGDPWRVRDTIVKRQIDLVHAHDYKSSLILAPLRRLGVLPPLVRTLHGVLRPGFSKLQVYERLDRWWLRWHDAVVAVTDTIQSEMSLNLTVIENGISLPAKRVTQPPDPALEAARAFCRNALVLGCLTRLSPEKNLGALLAAIAGLGRTGLPAKLIVLGEGPDRRSLEAQASRLGIADRVWLPGFRSNVQSWLPLFDFYVQASKAEGLPISLLEAMHARVPLLVTPIAGMKDLIARDAAIEIPFEGPAIAEVVRTHWDTETGRLSARVAAEAALSLVRTRYKSERMATEYAALYREVLDRQPAGPGRPSG